MALSPFQPFGNARKYSPPSTLQGASLAHGAAVAEMAEAARTDSANRKYRIRHG